MPISKSKIFLGLSLSFVFGIAFASLLDIPKEALYTLLAFSAAFFGISFYSKNSRSALLALFLFVCALGSIRLQAALKPSEYKPYFGEKIRLEGYIVEDIDVRQSYQLLTFLPKGSKQRILVTAALGQDYFYGDWIIAEGKLAQAKNFEDFDYQKYLERYNVYALMKYPKVLVLKSHRQNLVKEGLLAIKHRFVLHVQQLLPEPHASLLMGILIGAKKSLPQNVLDNFSRTGTSHIVAISGFNISIIIAALELLSRYLGRRLSSILSSLLITAFIVLAGPSASVIRAAIMGALLLLSFNLGRQYAVLPAMFFAAVIMLLFNPLILYWDTGFQLSFLATLGIVLLVPVLENLTSSWPNIFQVKGVLFATLSAIIFTLPAIMHYFGVLSLVAPLANLVILPLVPWSMLFGFLCALPWVGAGCAFLEYYLLSFLLKALSFFSHLPFASFEFKISAVVCILLYVFVGLLCLGLIRLNHKKEAEGL